MRNELKFDCGHKAWIDHKDDPDNPGGIIKIPGGFGRPDFAVGVRSL